MVLAAGASTRMGRPKQLLLFQGQTLLRRAIQTALDCHCGPVIVVLGSNANVMAPEVVGSGAEMIVNPHWSEGMSSSIRCGISALPGMTSVKPDAVLITLCDQPLVTAAVLGRFIQLYESEAPLLITSEYLCREEKVKGVPALFTRTLFSELLALRGKRGAQAVISRHVAEARFLLVPEAAIDVDTPEGYKSF